MPGAPLVYAFAITEFDEMFHEVFRRARGVRPEKLPMEMKVRHHASFSLSNRISIIGAMRSYSMRYVASLIGMSTPSLLLISCTHFTA